MEHKCTSSLQVVLPQPLIESWCPCKSRPLHLAAPAWARLACCSPSGVSGELLDWPPTIAACRRFISLLRVACGKAGGRLVMRNHARKQLYNCWVVQPCASAPCASRSAHVRGGASTVCGQRKRLTQQALAHLPVPYEQDALHGACLHRAACASRCHGASRAQRATRRGNAGGFLCRRPNGTMLRWGIDAECADSLYVQLLTNSQRDRFDLGMDLHWLFNNCK